LKAFFDTSVLVAAFWRDHEEHAASLRIFAAARKSNSACSIHSLAEVYSTMSRLPVKPPVPSEQALLFVQEVRARLRLISLEEEEYFEAMQVVADRKFLGGRVYDALLLRSASKCGAQQIYTWNVKQFRAIAPELSDRIQTP
jgi:predicted nucleic acid-binding protein